MGRTLWWLVTGGDGEKLKSIFGDTESTDSRGWKATMGEEKSCGFERVEGDDW